MDKSRRMQWRGKCVPLIATRRKRWHTEMFLANLKGRDNLIRLGVGDKIILSFILEKKMMCPCGRDSYGS
jgi:hypothetical protein